MMKLSKYNYFQDYNNEVVGINLISKKIFCIRKEKYDLLLKYNEGLINEKEVGENLISAMRKLGVLIENEFDELLQINSLHRQQIFSDASFRLTLNPTLECNFGCWYCYETHTKSKMSSEVSQNIIKLVNNKVNNREINGINLDWFGGEPLIYFNENVYPISKKILVISNNNNLYFTNSITTNGYLINHNYIKKFQEIKLLNFQITLDGNEKQHNKIRRLNGGGDTFKTIIENIHKLCINLKEVKVLLRLNYTKENLDGFVDIIPLIDKEIRNKIEISFQQVWQKKDETGIIDLSDFRRLFYESGFKEDNERLNFKGYTCYADKKNQALINYDGKVYKCTARDFSKQNPDGILNNDGYIEWDNNLFSKRFGRTTYENTMCYECSLIPVCFGPCSQKIVESKTCDDLMKFCLKDGVIVELNSILKDYHNKVTLK